MNSQKCKLNFVILHINLAIGSSNFIGIMNQIHYIDNQLNLNFQPISLHIVNNLMILALKFTTSQYQFYEPYNFIS